jgi:antagonist of KipI
VPRSGACDPWSLAIANLVVGNEPDQAALEMTLSGPVLRVLRSCVIGLAGADLGAAVQGGRSLRAGGSYRLSEGDVVTFAGAGSHPGARAYLALPGGVDVAVVLGSRSTCLGAGFGGLDGRPLRAGDRLGCERDPHDAPDGVAWIDDGPNHAASGDEEDPGTIRVLPGPDAGMLEPLAAATWSVGSASDRMGLRLDGPSIVIPDAAGERRPHGVVPGTVQLPPGGLPIVLLADAQPTGGYPVPAVAISADLSRLGQLRPGDPLRLVVVDGSSAEGARRDRAARLERGRARIARLGDWDALWRSAQG